MVRLRTACAGMIAGSLILSLGWAVPVLAGEWMADSKTGCRVWNGYPEPGESISWNGPCEEGYASGAGTLLWFKDGKPNGNYVGERKGGKANGHGINTWLNGDRYEGSWKDDAPNGKGTYTWTNGSGYQGDWREGKKHGRAIYIWANGDRFEGLYENDKPVSGTYIKADGSRYLADTTSEAIGPGSRLFTAEERLSVRRVGTKVCRTGSNLFGLMEAKLVGFVETVTDDKVQIRVVDTGFGGQNYLGIPVNAGTILWDDPENWGPC